MTIEASGRMISSAGQRLPVRDSWQEEGTTVVKKDKTDKKGSSAKGAPKPKALGKVNGPVKAKASTNRKPRGKAVARPEEMWERIAKKAYELYERRGRGDGRALEDWVEAEEAVMAEIHEARK